MKIIKTALPLSSALNVRGEKFDYSDSYRSHCTDSYDIITPTYLGKAFLSSAPKWTESLFVLRNKLVSVFGLKTSSKPVNKANILANFQCETGERIGLFKVFGKTGNEVILGEDDKHLNFRVSILYSPCASGKEVTISTTVKFNNWLGRLYFLPVRPIHKLIAPAMLKGMIKNIEKNQPLA